MASGRPTTVQVIADGTDSNSTGVALGYARTVVADYSAEQSAARLPGGARAAPIDVDIRVWFNPQLESRDFMMPGIVALLLLVVTTNLSAMAIVREKEVGTLEQLNVTPLARWELIVGKLLPYALIGMIDVVLVRWCRSTGSRCRCAAASRCCSPCSLIYLLSTLGLGLFVSTISQTQQQAMMTATFFFLTPMIYLSGFIFPIENMPAWIQSVTYADPAALLPGDRARHLPEGRGPRRAVAADGGAPGLRARPHHAGDAQVEQAPGLTASCGLSRGRW